MLEDKKVCILNVHPAPYRDSIYTALKRRQEFEFRVINYFNEDKGHQEWEWPSFDSPSISIDSNAKFIASEDFPKSLRMYLDKNKFHVLIIPGYRYLNSLNAIVQSRLRSIPIILNIDSVLNSAGMPKRNYFSDQLVKNILKTATCFWVPGKASRKYLNHYKIADERIFEGSYSFNADIILSEVKKNKKIKRELKIKYGVDQYSFIFLTIGKMIKSRNFPFLTEVFNKINIKNCNLLIVGDGSDYNEVKNFITSNKIKNIRLIGVLPFNHLSEVYAIADVYVHAGSEPYSTATEYAAITGVPVIASKEVGYIHDLLYYGVQPLLFEYGDSDDLLNQLITAYEKRHDFVSSSEIISRTACTRNSIWAAEELSKAINFVLDLN